MGYFPQILAQEGVTVTWKKRQEGAADPDTGDLAITWTTEDISAIVQPVRADEIAFEPGYSVADYVRIFVTADIQQNDRVVWQGAEWEILPPESFYFRGNLEYRTALCRRVLT